MSKITPIINTYSIHIATIAGHKLYLADFPAEKDGHELTLFNSLRFFDWNKSILSCFKEFLVCYKTRIPKGARFFVYCINNQSYEIWSRDYK